MSKRLNKRQLREQEELAELKAVQEEHVAGVAQSAEETEEIEVEDEEEQGEGEKRRPVNAFAALNAGDDSANIEEDEDESDKEEVVAKKSKKKKTKKKKAKSTTVDIADSQPEADTDPSHRLDTATNNATKLSKTKPKKGKGQNGTIDREDDGMDEIDKALAALGETSIGGSLNQHETSSAPETKVIARLRKSLAVQTKDLDPELELKRFFGSKVIASASAASATSASSNSARHQKLFSLYLSKLRYTLVKPLPNWPITSPFSGLSMREYTPAEVEDKILRRGGGQVGEGGDLLGGEERAGGKGGVERWFTWEHEEGWRQVQYQFLGAIRSHDPNQLQALLSVYNWHIDTLLQLSQVYQQQNDVGAASDFCFRAIFAYDRALAPGFNLGGMCRVDFDRVENRGLFLALNRNIAHLAKRGLWSSAFNYAKLLLSLDPHDDPHGALLWLDFLSIKSNNLDWIVEAEEVYLSAFLPGLVYNKALAAKMRLPKGSTDTGEVDEMLRDAIKRFPQAIPILADKAGVNMPTAARSHPMFELQVTYQEDDQTPNNLLCHIYAGRNAPLWKESSNAAWLASQIATVASDLTPSQRAQGPHLPFVRKASHIPGGIPLWLVRHAYLSEGFMGWVPPQIASNLGHAYDPIPPTTAITIYDNEYFNGRHSGRGRGGAGGSAADQTQTRSIQDMLRRVLNGGGEGMDRLLQAMGFAAPDEQMGPEVQQQIARMLAAEVLPGEGWDGEGDEEDAMPGAFRG